MKKQLIALLLTFGILQASAGCSDANALQNPAVTSPQTGSVSGQTLPAASGSAPMLTREQAEQIALDYLGFAPDQVTRLRTEYEIDNGIAQYDVQFYQGDWEYEFEISAEDGRILSYDKDHKYD